MMECSSIQLLNLPDEILIVICKNLDNVEMLYSLFNVSIRLDQILCDPIFTTQITLIKENSSYELSSSLSDLVLHRFCSVILPQIYQNIKWLSVETLSMERIILAAPNYPNLSQLDLFIMNGDTDMDLFTYQSPLCHIFQKQILTLCVDGKLFDQDHSKLNSLGKLFSNIIRLFNNVHHLKFYQTTPCRGTCISFAKQCPTFSSAFLVELHINVYRFDDCLSLLDGRFNQLRILFVNSFHILSTELPIINTEKIPGLKHFSLHCFNDTCEHEVIVPHLQRMINLQKLALYFMTYCHNTFIDGNYFKTNITNYMPQLNEFKFNIRSIVQTGNPIHLQTNEYICSTFEYFKTSEIITYVDYFPEERYGQCHVYTYPYTQNYYEGISNRFPGGLFNMVEEVQLFDQRPFDHAFFVKISQAFPFLKTLTVTNSKPQNFYDDRNLSIIEYSHLTKLHLFNLHDDYVEQFLFDTKAYLPSFIRLTIDCSQLQRVTDNFISDKTRNNCSKIKRLSLHDDLKLPTHYRSYFPHLED